MKRQRMPQIKNFFMTLAAASSLMACGGGNLEDSKNFVSDPQLDGLPACSGGLMTANGAPCASGTFADNCRFTRGGSVVLGADGRQLCKTLLFQLNSDNPWINPPAPQQPGYRYSQFAFTPRPLNAFDQVFIEGTANWGRGVNLTKCDYSTPSSSEIALAVNHGSVPFTSTSQSGKRVAELPNVPIQSVGLEFTLPNASSEDTCLKWNLKLTAYRCVDSAQTPYPCPIP